MRSLLLAVLLPAVAFAQPASVAAGARIRLFTPDLPQWTTATLIAQPGDSFAVRLASGEDRMVSRASIIQLDVSRGLSRRKGARRGALLGAIVGFALPVGIGLANGDQGPEGFGPSPIAVGIVFGALCAIPGALVGSFFPAERWERLIR